MQSSASSSHSFLLNTLNNLYHFIKIRVSPFISPIITPILSINLLYLHATSYVVTGVLTAYFNQLISYEGLNKESTLILPFAAYLGMFGVILFPESFFSSSSASGGGVSLNVKGGEDEGEVEMLLKSNVTRSASMESNLQGGEEIEMGPQGASSPMNNRKDNSAYNPEVVIPVLPAPINKSGGQPSSPTPAIFLKLGVRGILACMIFCDFAGMVLSMLGMQLCGSGLHTVVMSSIVCWAAVISYAALNKRIDGVESGSLLIIMLGLVMSATAQKGTGVVEIAKGLHGVEIEKGVPGIDHGVEGRGEGGLREDKVVGIVGGEHTRNIEEAVGKGEEGDRRMTPEEIRDKMEEGKKLIEEILNEEFVGEVKEGKEGTEGEGEGEGGEIIVEKEVRKARGVRAAIELHVNI